MSAVKNMRSLGNIIKLSPPDLMVVSIEGMKFPTWRLLLAMHSPLLANLLQTLRPGEEGLLAVTLPLPYVSVSSMLAILGEGGNLDHLGEAAQLLGFSNNMLSAGSAPSQIPTKEGNPKNFPRMTEIQEGGSLVIVGTAPKHPGTNKMLFGSTFTKVPVEKRNPGTLHKSHSTDESSDQHSLVNTATSMVEISPKEFKIDLSEYSDASQIFSRNNVFDKSANAIESESGSSGALDKTNNDGITEENLEEVFIDVIDVKTDHTDSKPSQEGSKAPWPAPGSLTPGLLFPDYDSMTTSLNEWSRANFSPLTKASSGTMAGSARAFHTFKCPHKKAKRRSSSLGIRRPRANQIEYADCPFVINTKVNPDGSCVVTRAITEHRGHPDSEEHFQRYRR